MPRKRTLEEQQLTDTNYYILLAMMRPIHGYGIMQRVREISDNTFEIGPASLYTSLQKMQEAGLILLLEIADNDRKIYQITDRGKDLLKKDYERRKFMVERGRIIMEVMESEK